LKTIIAALTKLKTFKTTKTDLQDDKGFVKVPKATTKAIIVYYRLIKNGWYIEERFTCCNPCMEAQYKVFSWQHD
jgi:hypothetical protein